MAKTSLQRISTADLRRELDARARSVAPLNSKRTRLAAELSALDAEIEALAAGAVAKLNSKAPRSKSGRNGRKRTRASRTRRANAKPLHAALHQVLKGKTMGVAEAAEAVKRAGYKTSSAHFRTMVNLTLIKRKDLFAKKARGQYSAK